MSNNKKSVMVVDDSRVSRLIIRTLVLEKRPDWEIIEAASGEEALQLAAQREPDYATLDINMPGMDGLELAGRLRVRHPRMVLCMLTANVQESSRQQAVALGIGFAKKPVDQACVAAAIEYLETPHAA